MTQTAGRPPSVVSSALASTWGIGVQGLARLAYTVLIGRAFGTEALGHASALLSLSIFAALLWPTAAGNTASRFLALARREGDDARVVSQVLGWTVLLSSGVLAVATVPVSRALGNDWPTSVLAAWLVMGYGAYAHARGARLGLDGARRVAVWDTLTSVLSLGLLVAVCASGQGSLVLAPLAAAYTAFAVACGVRERGRPADDPARRRAVLAFAAWNVLAGLTTNGLLQVAMIAAQLVGSGREAGVYAAAFTLATPASMLGQAVSQVVIPAFAGRSGTDLRRRGPLLFVASFGAVATLVLGAVAALAPWFLPLFYPSEGDDAVPVLRFLMLAVLVFTVGLVPAALLLAAGRSREVALVSVAGFVLGLASLPLLVPVLGVSAGTGAFLIGSSVNLVAVVLLGLRRRPDDDEALPLTGAPQVG